MDYLRYDSILREILEDRKTLTGFLDAIFGFMSRNTDFYHIQNTISDKLGFPRGVKEQILMSCMQKYEHAIEQSKLKYQSDEGPSFVVEEVEIVAEENKGECNKCPQIADKNFIEMLETSKSGAFSTKFNESEYRNGSVFDDYCWSQTLKDIELYVLLPKEAKQGKHIKLDLKANHITIKILTPKEKTLINAETWDKYRHNDVIWSISEGKLVVSFDKLKECWWDKLFSNENSINIKNVDTERSIEDYPPDIQNAFEQIHTQRNDFKTSPLNESGQMARLRQAWNAEGSPFKGQPFDPSIIHFD